MIDWQALTAYARSVSAQDHSGHGFDHIERVIAMAKRLVAETPSVDSAVVVAAATMHDTYDDKLVNDVAAARSAARHAMAAAGLTDEQIQAIIAIIDHMSFKANLGKRQPLSIEGQLVQDADRLDAIGAIGIGRAFMYGGAHGGRMYDPALAPRTALTPSSYRTKESTIINHFYEKLLKLKDQLNTSAAKQLAEHRQQVMEDFLTEFKAEWGGER
ncbi:MULTISPECIES: HD domain-containing protein [Lacticaseibacillus]|uniref:HD domain-containing protein n=2 Tax=Lacticaseibacillus TaxID=2759736 RepID=A0AAN1F0N4_LACCA|nr:MULTISPECIES: HD domain-containing protein [Lacticaseibacillus]ARY92571.1 phosphohydrolase [Lacticaseibacillus casei]KAB1969588.1 HD domain-containing protein [Lacticaseibacillus casei]WLV80472.1 HD domain-containing protein [Lacticaseibacillus sp. NCIMB 15473]WNX24433.1 HD domain-containing protein [Lacticaseibacillus casei]WNX27205.1 HD domain-containing protein [Lacticaseibacillus casei]